MTDELNQDEVTPVSPAPTDAPETEGTDAVVSAPEAGEEAPASEPATEVHAA